jgi:hypothetical protein
MTSLVAMSGIGKASAQADNLKMTRPSPPVCHTSIFDNKGFMRWPHTFSIPSAYPRIPPYLKTKGLRESHARESPIPRQGRTRSYRNLRKFELYSLYSGCDPAAYVPPVKNSDSSGEDLSFAQILIHVYCAPKARNNRQTWGWIFGQCFQWVKACSGGRALDEEAGTEKAETRD